MSSSRQLNSSPIPSTSTSSFTVGSLSALTLLTLDRENYYMVTFFYKDDKREPSSFVFYKCLTKILKTGDTLKDIARVEYSKIGRKDLLLNEDSNNLITVKEIAILQIAFERCRPDVSVEEGSIVDDFNGVYVPETPPRLEDVVHATTTTSSLSLSDCSMEVQHVVSDDNLTQFNSLDDDVQITTNCTSVTSNIITMVF